MLIADVFVDTGLNRVLSTNCGSILIFVLLRRLRTAERRTQE
jgi:hypothetical protein